jgi:hypothetical protein
MTRPVDNRRGGYNNNNSYQRRPYERPPPPETKEDEMEDIEIRLKGLIIKIGDKVTSKTLKDTTLDTECILS